MAKRGKKAAANDEGPEDEPRLEPEPATQEAGTLAGFIARAAETGLGLTALASEIQGRHEDSDGPTDYTAALEAAAKEAAKAATHLYRSKIALLAAEAAAARGPVTGQTRLTVLPGRSGTSETETEEAARATEAE